RPKKEGLQKRRPVFRSNIDALCLHCEEAHLTEGTFVNLFELPDPDPDSLRHMLELKDHFGRCSSCSCEAKPCA
ncbi:unnamed protein product, partial [Durusdinium trenchii]